MSLFSFLYNHDISSTRFSLVSVSLVYFWLLMCPAAYCAKPLRVVSYNVENLFHPKHDSVAVIDSAGRDTLWIEKDDYEWTPDGERHWTYTKYYNKVYNLAKVLTHIGQWDGVDIVGLCEVENAKVVEQLCKTLRFKSYDFVHYESPDRRGIDVAMIYQKSRIDTLRTRAIRIDHPELKTRDILYVCGRVDRRDTVHFFVCHLPSQRGGAKESQWKRDLAKQVLQNAVDSVLETNSHAKIVVMGDMNCTPTDDIRGLTNKMIPFAQSGKGTHKWQGQWTCLDQFYTSNTLDSIVDVQIYEGEMIQEKDQKFMGLKPMRTYVGYRYQNGFSDHLPIVLNIKW